MQQESFSIVFTLCFLRLIGHYFLVETDHRNIVFVHSRTSAKVVRWSLTLQQFSFGMSYIPGESDDVADTLKFSGYPGLRCSACPDAGRAAAGIVLPPSSGPGLTRPTTRRWGTWVSTRHCGCCRARGAFGPGCLAT
jgi:hypothetical protein